MYQCPKCREKLEFNKESENFQICPNCESLSFLSEKDNRITAILEEDYPNTLYRSYPPKILISIRFKKEYFEIFQRKSPKMAEVIKKLIKNGKSVLSSNELNLMYKLKNVSLEDTKEKIQYLEVKTKFILLLKILSLLGI